MKLKRFMAIVISLAMVLSIVPAFNLTASAAEEVVLFDATTLDRTSSTGDIALSEGNWSGDWGAVFSNNWGNNTGTWGSNGPTALMFFRTSERGSGKGTDTKTATYGGASASAGANKITISFRYAIQEASDCYQTWYFRDIDGTRFARFYGDKNTSGGTASVGLNTQSTFISSGGTLPIRGEEFSIVATQGASNWTVEYYRGTTLLNTDTVTSINGFGSIQSEMPEWNAQWAAAGMQGLKITYEMPETSKEIVATYTAGGATVKTVSKTIDTSLTDSASFDEYYYSVNGENTLYYAAAQTLTDSTTIEMTALENKGSYAVNDEIVIDNTPYVVKSANLIPNYNFEYGTAGWFGGDGNQLGASVSGNAVTLGNAGGGNNASLNQSWAIESGKTYLYTYNTTSANGWHITSLQNAVKSDENTTGAPVLVGTTNNSVYTGTLGASDAAGTNNFVFTNTDGYAYLQSAFRWTGATLSNFGLYEVEVDSSKIANTTIKFVDSSNTSTELQTAVTVTGVVGDVITIADYAPSTITYNGNPYSFDSTNPASYTVVGNTDVVTLTYTTDAYVKFTADPITVIAGNDPVMPTTVTAVTGAGSTTEVSGATFTGYTGLSAGTHTVNGTVTIDGTAVSGTVEVTVLPMTFELEDITGNASTDNATTYFPVDVTGDFYLEFDFNASNLDNLWIYASANGAQWGSGQIGLGWDNAGNGYFRAQPAAQTDIVFETNKTYRFLVHGNVDTDTYDLVVYDTVTKEVVFTCEGYGFRSGSDMINSIFFSSNGEGGVGTLSNVKVYAPDQADQFTTVTFVATGSVDETYTTTYTSAEEFPIPHYDGHIMKTRTI
ncbi:MAG: hypothetical protein IJ316_02870, partial [Clostridia bacterium]|nr:hypothetical protein [Clostridia bacterium]